MVVSGAAFLPGESNLMFWFCAKNKAFELLLLGYVSVHGVDTVCFVGEITFMS